jgi:hypothetical protein
VLFTKYCYQGDVGNKRNAYKISIGNPEEKKSQERPGHSQKLNVEIGDRAGMHELDSGGLEWRTVLVGRGA